MAPILPTTYRIGKNILDSPLVVREQVKAHLTLLEAFHHLKKTIQGAKPDDLRLPSEVALLDLDRRWAWFVGLAVDRFHKWVLLDVAQEPGMSLAEWVSNYWPPLDVAMVWHAYMLNPSWYAEDCERLKLLNTIKGLNSRLLDGLAVIGNLRNYHPSPSRSEDWKRRTKLPFDPRDSIPFMTHRSVFCPQCNHEDLHAYLTLDGTGYLQHKFSRCCPKCWYKINKERLALGKLMHDVCSDSESNADVAQSYLAGSLYSSAGLFDAESASHIKDKIFTKFYRPVGELGQWRDPKSYTKEELVKRLMCNVDYSMDKVRLDLSKTTFSVGLNQSRRIKRILSAYSDDQPFSVALVGAVIRQGAFIEKMHNLNWMESTFLESLEGQLIIDHAIARYHGFLDMCAIDENGYFVPTLDIDLVWHTHQLAVDSYRSDCFKYVGRFIDHDDKVDPNRLATSFDVTSIVWEQRFKVPYTHCGCPSPDRTLSHKLSQLSIRLSHPHSHSHGRYSPLQPPLPHQEEFFSATHPSEHNSVDGKFAPYDRQQRVRDRIDDKKKRRARDAELVKKGRLDEDKFKRGEFHETSFLHPVPFFRSGWDQAPCIVPNGSLSEGSVCSAEGGSCYSSRGTI